MVVYCLFDKFLLLSANHQQIYIFNGKKDVACCRGFYILERWYRQKENG
jgi:hypothetical protein